MFLLLEKQICLNPLESGRVVKLNYLEVSMETIATVLIPLNRVMLLNLKKLQISSKAIKVGLNPLESGRVVKSTTLTYKHFFKLS